jgi:micrococcal nuclease
MVPLITLIEKRYSGQEEKCYSGLGRGYVYASGGITEYRDTPQIELTDISQLSDVPPGSH